MQVGGRREIPRPRRAVAVPRPGEWPGPDGRGARSSCVVVVVCGAVNWTFGCETLSGPAEQRPPPRRRRRRGRRPRAPGPLATADAAVGTSWRAILESRSAGTRRVVGGGTVRRPAASVTAARDHGRVVVPGPRELSDRIAALPGGAHALAAIGAGPEHVYLVGGAVRDLALGGRADRLRPRRRRRDGPARRATGGGRGAGPDPRAIWDRDGPGPAGGAIRPRRHADRDLPATWGAARGRAGRDPRGPDAA